MTSKKRQALAKLINRIALSGHAERSREAEEIMAVLEDTGANIVAMNASHARAIGLHP